ncbi:MAG: hypothetical protein D4R95_01080 [Actinobacteria bacterium]|nr:MAG: hypothetical protein D4R95_01080 [Actinomycetota bacterium]
MQAVATSTVNHSGLTNTWRTVAVVSWLLVFFAIIAVAVTSRNIGKPTWWLGPQSNPSFVLLWALPFVAPIASIIAAIKFGRVASYVGLGSALLLGAIGAADINGTPGVALVECAIAVSSALIAIATFAGRTTVSRL